MLNNPGSHAMLSLIQRQEAFLREAERERLLRSAEPGPTTLPEPRRPSYHARWRSIASVFALIRPLGHIDLAR